MTEPIRWPTYNDVDVGLPRADTGRYEPRLRGKLIPHVEVTDEGATVGGERLAGIRLDGRMVYVMTVEQIPMMLNMIADAMAISNGHNCFAGPKKDPWGPPDPALAKL